MIQRYLILERTRQRGVKGLHLGNSVICRGAYAEERDSRIIFD